MDPLAPYGSDLHHFLHRCGVGNKVLFSKGEIVHEANSLATSFFIVESGEIRRYNRPPKGNPHLIDILGVGDWFGGPAIPNLCRYDCRAVSVGNSTVWTCPAESMRKFLATHGEVALQLAESVLSQLHQSWANAGGLAFDNCRSRLVKTLLRFSESAAAKKTPEGVVLKITHAQLAQAVGAARETVSLCLTKLSQKQIVRTGRNQLSFNPVRLREIESGTADAPFSDPSQKPA